MEENEQTTGKQETASVPKGCYVAMVIAIVVLIVLVLSMCSKCSNYMDELDKENYVADVSKAGIIADTFIKLNLTNPSESDFDMETKGSKTGENEFTVSRSFTSKNDFGVEKSYSAIIVMHFNGGEWADANNWEYGELVIMCTDGNVFNANGSYIK